MVLSFLILPSITTLSFLLYVQLCYTDYTKYVCATHALLLCFVIHNEYVIYHLNRKNQRKPAKQLVFSKYLCYADFKRYLCIYGIYLAWEIFKYLKQI